MGVLSALPIVSAGNYCCCLWVISGGLVAAYVLQQNQAAPITQGDGAIAGLAAGVTGAFVYLVISIPISLLVAPMERELLQRIIEGSNRMPPEAREFAMRFASGPVRLIVGFIFMLFIGAIFSTIGGLLGSIFFRKSLPPPATPDVPVAPPA